MSRPHLLLTLALATAPLAACVEAEGFPNLDAIAPSVVEIDGELIPLRQRHATIKPGGGWFDVGAGLEVYALTDDPRLPLAMIFTAEAPVPGVYAVDNPFGMPRFKLTFDGIRLEAESGRFEIVAGAAEEGALFHVRSEGLVMRDACGTTRRNVRFELTAVVEESLDHYWDHIVSPAYGFFEGPLRVGDGPEVPFWGLLLGDIFTSSDNDRLLQGAGASFCEVDNGWRLDLIVERRDIRQTTHPTDGRWVAVLLSRHTFGELQQDQFLSVPLDRYTARQGSATFAGPLEERLGEWVDGELNDVVLEHFVRDGSGAQVLTGQEPAHLSGRFRLFVNVVE